MKIYIDTSSLFKKYHVEQGSGKILHIMKTAAQIIVSPLTHLEMMNTGYRFYFEKRITDAELELYCQSIHHDFQSFSVVPWDEDLKNLCLNLIKKHKSKTLDIIQLASGIKSAPHSFITSDKKQYKIAKKEF